ncbi:MAG TPA: nitroreductase [Syntrophales bacterium]
MELEAAIRGRRSIRKFRPDPIPTAVLKDLLETASWAPSWGNTQPWELYVITGEPLEAFRKANAASVANGETLRNDVPMPEKWPEEMKIRYMDIGRSVVTSLGLKREDKEGRRQHQLNMAALFGAPCLIIATVPKDVLVEYAMLDVGLLLQTIALIAHDKGLGTCIMASAIHYADHLRTHGGIPVDSRIIMGVAMGYPEKEAPLNRFDRQRAGLEAFVKWVG